ncbi:MAG: hypothetical protein RMK01_04095 [Thermomicrobium sp.]|nr:hypothetical protein [Thermomicrobium sp.]
MRRSLRHRLTRLADRFRPRPRVRVVVRWDMPSDPPPPDVVRIRLVWADQPPTTVLDTLPRLWSAEEDGRTERGTTADPGGGVTPG